ncbi:MAG: hypothetical protein EOO73_00875 [Myxococcales bacterium]|nr:MAG: hypothetical protein EOO73_00875 [Myxococcales bacterium]
MKSSLLLTIPALLCFGAPVLAQQPAPAPASSLEAGGLRPPEAVDSSQPAPAENAAPSPEQELEKADREDAGRGLEWIWLNAEVGAQHLGLQTLKADGLVDPKLVKTTQTGLLYGAGIGARILVFTVGARFRMGTFKDWQLWTLDAEGGFRIPIGSLEPYVNVAAGYASLGSPSTDAPAASKANVRGVHARVGAGVDYYLSNTFSVGGNLSGDLLFLSRSKVEGAEASTNGDEAAVYSKDGSSIGAGTSLTAVVGLHF